MTEKSIPLWRRVIRFPHPDREVTTLLLAILIGVLAGYGALLFRFVLRSMQWLFYQHGEDVLSWIGSVPWYLKIAMPALGGLIAGVVIHFFASEAKGHGVPEVMEAIALRRGHIRKRVALAKIFASAVTIGSGGSVGREGPMVQIGASIGSTLGQLFKVPSIHMKTVVGCGAAAGIAATFNAPIAGVLFALEIIIGDFGLMSFSPVVLASVTATTISRYYLGDLPAFVIPDYTIVSLWEFGLYPLLGIATAFAALIFTKTVYLFEDGFDLMPLPGWLKPALGGAVLGGVIIWFPEAFGVGYGAMNLSLTNQLGFWALFTLAWVKIFASSLTLGSGGSGGIFAPSLFIGAMTGGGFGCAVNWLWPTLTAAPGAYALVAMGGVVAGTTYAPITAILIIFELTGDYSIILPLMITCILTTVLTSSIRRGSIYTIKLLRRGIDITAGREQTVLRNTLVRESMDSNIFTIPEFATLSEIIWTFKTENAPYLHVVNNENKLVGIISFRDIRAVLQEPGLQMLIIAKDLATTDLSVITPDNNLEEASALLTKRGVSQLPVVHDRVSMRPMGTLTESAIAAAYNQAVVRHEIDHPEAQ
ncbi:MAG: chloride channel protein [Proteobacteria bacterium]|nr:chloride channel protein [Pseudomonadota bacterium]MBU1612264.1 chloride channel protein [Pseudomonadota bacterium]